MSEREFPPSECPHCGGPIDFAERESDGEMVTLCKGDCGSWQFCPAETAPSRTKNQTEGN